MFKLIRIEKFVEKNVRISQGFVGSLCLYRQEKGLDFEKLKVLGVTIKNKRVLDLVSWAELSNMAALCPNLCVVFDHALGGGTETYFKNKVAELKEKYQFLRVQYFRKNEAYLVALLSAESEKSAPAPSFEALSNMLLGGGEAL